MIYDPFPATFAPHARAIKLLALIANDEYSQHRHEARDALTAWRESLATPEQIAAVETDDDLEIDDKGACVSPSLGGYFIQTWTWVAT